MKQKNKGRRTCLNSKIDGTDHGSTNSNEANLTVQSRFNEEKRTTVCAIHINFIIDCYWIHGKIISWNPFNFPNST